MLIQSAIWAIAAIAERRKATFSADTR